MRIGGNRGPILQAFGSHPLASITNPSQQTLLPCTCVFFRCTCGHQSLESLLVRCRCWLSSLGWGLGVCVSALLPGDTSAAGLPSLLEEQRPSAVAPSLGSFLGNTWEPLKHYCLGSFSREYDFIGLKCQLHSRIFQNSLGESTVVIKTHDLKWSSKNVVLPAPSASPVNRLEGTFLGSIPDTGQELRGGPGIYVVTRLCVS